MITIPGSGSSEPFVVKITGGGIAQSLRNRGLMTNRNEPICLYYQMTFKPKMETDWFFSVKNCEVCS